MKTYFFINLSCPMILTLVNQYASKSADKIL